MVSNLFRLHQYFATGHNIHRENPKAVADAVRFVAAVQKWNPMAGLWMPHG